MRLPFRRVPAKILPAPAQTENKRLRQPATRAKWAIGGIIVIACAFIAFSFIYAAGSSYYEMRMLDLTDDIFAWLKEGLYQARIAAFMFIFWLFLVNQCDILMPGGLPEIKLRRKKKLIDQARERVLYTDGSVAQFRRVDVRRLLLFPRLVVALNHWVDKDGVHHLDNENYDEMEVDFLTRQKEFEHDMGKRWRRAAEDAFDLVGKREEALKTMPPEVNRHVPEQAGPR